MMARKVSKPRKSPRLTKMKTRVRRQPERYSSELYVTQQDNLTAKPKDPKSRAKLEETSPNTTMEIIDKLSKQYMKVDREVSFKNGPRLSRKEVFDYSLYGKRKTNILNSSFTSTPASTDTSTKSTDCYDFDQDDSDIKLRLDLSPIATSGRTPTEKKSRKSSFSVPSSGGKRNRSLSKNKENKEICKNQTRSSTKRRKVDSQKTVEAKNMKNNKKSKTPTNRLRIIKQSCQKSQKTSPTSKQTLRVPSSVKQSQSTNGLVTISNAGQLSTPRQCLPSDQNKLATKPKQQTIEPSLAFDVDPDYDMPGSPKLSPVKPVVSPSTEVHGALIISQSESNLFDDIDFGIDSRPSTPMTNEQQTPATQKTKEEEKNFKVLNISRTYANLGYGYYDKPLSSKKKKKVTKKQNRISVSRYDLIATQMNQEFDDIDNFQLSID